MSDPVPLVARLQVLLQSGPEAGLEAARVSSCCSCWSSVQNSEKAVQKACHMDDSRSQSFISSF